jgi:hypothetical protein
MPGKNDSTCRDLWLYLCRLQRYESSPPSSNLSTGHANLGPPHLWTIRASLARHLLTQCLSSSSCRWARRPRRLSRSATSRIWECHCRQISSEPADLSVGWAPCPAVRLPAPCVLETKRSPPWPRLVGYLEEASPFHERGKQVLPLVLSAI